MGRALVVVAGGLLGLVLAVLAPWAAVPLVLLGLFLGGMLVDRPEDDRSSRKQVAHRVGMVVGLLVAAAWWGGGPMEPTGLVRVLLASTLGCGAGLGALGATLIGMDAHPRNLAPLE